MAFSDESLIESQKKKKKHQTSIPQKNWAALPQGIAGSVLHVDLLSLGRCVLVMAPLWLVGGSFLVKTPNRLSLKGRRFKVCYLQFHSPENRAHTQTHSNTWEFWRLYYFSVHWSGNVQHMLQHAALCGPSLRKFLQKGNGWHLLTSVWWAPSLCLPGVF